MRLAHRRLVAALILALPLGCAGRGSNGRGANARGPRADANEITRTQIAAVHYTSAYDVVEALHSNWLRPRGPDSFQTPGQVLVYLDNNRVGGVESLRAIAPGTIASMRFYDAVTATGRWGVGHTQGVIYVATQVGP